MSPCAHQKEKTDMKKALYIIMLSVALSSCSKNEIIRTVGETISFGNVFVDKTTKAVQDPSHTTSNLDRFYVYGNVTGKPGIGGNTVNIYKGADVYKSGGVWYCDVTQYWVPDCTYDFAAVSDVDATDPTSGDYDVAVYTADGLPSSIKYNAASQKDLLHAEADGLTTNETATPSTGVDAQGHANPVPFTFSHLLSKVQFTFTNSFAESSGVQLTVTDIRITNAAKKATFTIGGTPEWVVDSWFSGTGSDCLTFGETGAIDAGGKKGTSSAQCVLVPCRQKFNITFTIKHNKGGSDTVKSITTDDITLERGHFYNFTADLNSGNTEGVVPITFNIITSDSWGSADEEIVGPVYPDIN